MKLFPTLIRLKPLRLGRTHEKLREESSIFQEIDTAGKRWSARNYLNGYTSYGSITDLPSRSPHFARLKKAIDREVKVYARALELQLDGGSLEMSACWINIMGHGTHHSFHLHPLSVISGTYYVQVPRGAGSFKIEDPRLGFFMGSPPRPPRARLDNQRFVDLKPKEGQLLLFESWLKHEVPANHSQVERISISFNYDWVRR